MEDFFWKDRKAFIKPFNFDIDKIPDDLVKLFYPKLLIKTSELARILNVGESTIEQGRLNGRFPIPFVKLNKSIRYRIEDVQSYISNLKSYHSTSEVDED